MPKTDSFVWNYYRKKQVSLNGTKLTKHAYCNFCNKKYVSSANRMIKHLLKCVQCPTKIKELFKTKKTGSAEPDGKVHSNNANLVKHRTLDDENSAHKNTNQDRLIPRNESISTFMDSITSSGKQNLDRQLARAIFSGTIPFSFVENPNFIKFLHLIRPAYKPPTRKLISTILLENEYSLIQNLVWNKIKNATSLTLLSDSWTDINGIPLINIVMATPEPVFIKSIDTKTNRHDSQYMFNILSEAIEDAGVDKVHAVCTDNAAVMKSTWSMLKEKYPSLINYGCSAHSFNLLAKDICKLPTFVKVIQEAKKIIQFFRNKHLPKQVLKRIQIDQRGSEISLLVPVDTRWSSVNSSIESLLKNKEYLQAAIFDKIIIKMVDGAMKKIVLDDDGFWKTLLQCSNILSPIATAIKIVEGDKASSISYIVPSFLETQEQIMSMCTLLKHNEQEELATILERRKLFLIYDVHLAAYLLNPKLIGEKLTETESTKAMEFILTMAQDMQINQPDVLSDLVNYKARADVWAQQIIWSAASCTNPVAWWQGLCSKKALSKVAIRILNFPSSSASCERNWKVFSSIKSKKRNRLTIDRTEKLVMVKCNLNLLDPEILEQLSVTRLKLNESHLITAECSNSNCNNNIAGVSETENATDSHQSDIDINSDGDDDLDLEYNTDDLVEDDDETSVCDENEDLRFHDSVDCIADQSMGVNENEGQFNDPAEHLDLYIINDITANNNSQFEIIEESEAFLEI